MPNTFLLKLHSDRCLGVSGAPKQAEEWEGQWFCTKAEPTSTKGRASNLPAPAPEDQAYIWVHEVQTGSNGRGLTALATIADIRISQQDEYIEALLKDVRLLDRPSFLGVSELGEFGVQRSRVAARIREYAHHQTMYIEADELVEWEKYLISRSQRIKSEEVERVEIQYANQPTKEHWKMLVKKQMRSVTVRTGQAQFREAVFARYGGACAVTNENVAATLDAAHVIPVAEDTTLGASPLNGVCLRADIHRLFDRGLLWFEKGRVVIADELRNTPYGAFKDKVIQPSPDESLLACRADAIKSARALPA